MSILFRIYMLESEVQLTFKKMLHFDWDASALHQWRHKKLYIKVCKIRKRIESEPSRSIFSRFYYK